MAYGCVKRGGNSGNSYFTYRRVNAGNYGSFGIAASSLTDGEWVYVQQRVKGSQFGDTLIRPGIALAHTGAEAGIILEAQGYQFEDITEFVRLQAETHAAITAEREARTTAINAQTAEITAAKSQIGNNTAAIDGIRSTKADKSEVAALARTSLASEWTAAAQTAAQTAKTQAVQAAASDAQAKASAAQRAAEQAAERLATAKANAAQAAAVAAASGDAQRKADAAKAAAIADAVAKDEAVKRAAAADAQSKADTAKQAAIAEANRLNTATNARVNTLEQTVSTQNSATATQIRNLTATIEQNRVAAELAKASVDGNVLHIAAPEGGSFAKDGTSTGAIKIRLPVRKTSTMLKFRVEIFDYATEKAASYEIAGYNYGGGSWYHPTVVMSGAAANTKNVRFGHDAEKDCVWIGELNSTWLYLKVRVVDLVAGHQGHTAANWQRGWQISVVTAFDTVQHTRNTLNPAKDAAQALADIATERTARVEADNALTQQLNTAKSQINGQSAQISRLESTKADQSSVSAQLQTTLQAAARDAQSRADAAKTAAERTAQAKAAEAQAAAERAAQLKADAAKAAALASASSDAQRKADAAKAAAVADAAAKDAVLKREAAADAQAKADAVRRLAEAARADITALQSTVANNDRAQSERTAALTAKVGTAEATVRTAQTAVTTLNGKVQAMHTLKVQAVGNRKAVAGIALGADGQTGDSQFVVMSDKFALARPGGSTVQMPFVVTTVGGQAQLALAGDMLVDGLIQGKHIAAGQTIRTPKLVAATLEIGSFTMQPSGAFTSRSTAPNQAGLSIDNDRIVIRDASGRVRIILGRLR